MLITILATVLSANLTILGPGALAPADPGVLEAVAERRLRNGWALDKDAADYDVLVAVAE